MINKKIQKNYVNYPIVVSGKISLEDYEFIIKNKLCIGALIREELKKLRKD